CWARLRARLLRGFLALLDSRLLLAAAPGGCLAWVLPWLGYWRGGRLARADVEWAEARRSFLLDSLHLLTPLLIWQRWPRRAAAFTAQDQQYLAQQDRQHRLIRRVTLLQLWELAASLLLVLGQGSLVIEHGRTVLLLLADALALLGLIE